MSAAEQRFDDDPEKKKIASSYRKTIEKELEDICNEVLVSFVRQESRRPRTCTCIL